LLQKQNEGNAREEKISWGRYPKEDNCIQSCRLKKAGKRTKTKLPKQTGQGLFFVITHDKKLDSCGQTPARKGGAPTNRAPYRIPPYQNTRPGPNLFPWPPLKVRETPFFLSKNTMTPSDREQSAERRPAKFQQNEHTGEESLGFNIFTDPQRLHLTGQGVQKKKTKKKSSGQRNSRGKGIRRGEKVFRTEEQTPIPSRPLGGRGKTTIMKTNMILPWRLKKKK